MIITSLLIITISLTLILVLFRFLRGESYSALHQELKELKVQDVPNYFLKSLKIVFDFRRRKKDR